MGTGAGVEAAGAAVGAVVGTGFAVAAGVPVLPLLVVLAATVVPEISKNMNAITDQIQRLQEETNDFIRKATMELQAHASELSQASQKQIESIEKSLEEELRKSLESFAGAMIALSNKFASDYTPLTDRLREVVRIAERMNNASLN